MALAVVVWAQAADGGPKDPKIIRETLVAAEHEHRDAYNAFDFAEAIAVAKRGLTLAESAGLLADQAHFLRNLAYDTWALGDNESALEYCGRVLSLAEQLNDNGVRSSGHRYLSLIFGTMGDADRSRAQANQAMRFAQLAKNESLRIYALASIARCRAHDNQLDQAERDYRECHAYWQAKGERRNMANVAARLAEVVARRGDSAGALQLYDKLFVVRAELHDPYGQTQVAVAIADLLHKVGRNEAALARLLAVQAQAKATASNRILAEYYESLSRAQEACGDFHAALASERLADSAHDELNSSIARVRALELESRLQSAQQQQQIEREIRDLSRHEAEIRLQEVEIAYRRDMGIAMIGGGIMTAALAIVIVVQRARLRRALQLASRAAGADLSDSPSVSP